MSATNFLEEYLAAAEDDTVRNTPSSPLVGQRSTRATGKRKRLTTDTGDDQSDEETDELLSNAENDDNLPDSGEHGTQRDQANSGHRSSNGDGPPRSPSSYEGNTSADKNLTTYAKRLGIKKRLRAEYCDDLVKFSEVGRSI